MPKLSEFMRHNNSVYLTGAGASPVRRVPLLACPAVLTCRQHLTLGLIATLSNSAAFPFASAAAGCHWLCQYFLTTSACGPSFRSADRSPNRTPTAFHSKAQGRRELVERRTLGMRTAQNQTPTGFYKRRGDHPRRIV